MKLLRRITSFIERHMSKFIFAVSVLLSAGSLAHFYMSGQILAYGDAESHINIAKRVVSGLTPGFGQLGGVWLPLHHLLMVPFVVNDFMWKSGIGGAVVSTLGFVTSAFFIYKIGALLSSSRWIGALVFFIYALNPNILYMQSTPMSELPLLAFLFGSIYYFIKWIYQPKLLYIVVAAAFIFAGSLVRYDAWFIAIAELLALIIMARTQKWKYGRLEATVILFATLAFFGCVLWLLWNQIIFNDALYFLNSPYSAKSQQLSFLATGNLPTYHNLFESIRYYVAAVYLNAGPFLSAAGVLGLAAYIFGKKRDFSKRFVILIILLSIFVFNITALVLGISILFIPGLTPASSQFQLFNIRYGMMLVPILAIFTGVAIYKIKNTMIRTVSVVAVIVFTTAFAFTQPITLQDGTSGLSARNPGNADDINKIFNKHYDYGYVAFDDFGKTANPISLSVPMNKIIYIGSHPYWEDMLKTPNNYARWLIIRNDDVLDKQLTGTKRLLDHYETVEYSKNNIKLYKCVYDCTPSNFVISKKDETIK